MKLTALKPAASLILAAAAGVAGYLAGRQQADSPARGTAVRAMQEHAAPAQTPPARRSPAAAALTFPGSDIASVHAWLSALEKSLPAAAAGDAAAAARLLLRHWQPAPPPAEAWAQASALPAGSLRSAMLERLWPALAAADPAAGWQASFLLSDEAASPARAQLTEDWLASGKNPADLAPLLNASPETERAEAAAAAMITLTAHSPSDALTAAAGIASEPARSSARLTIAGEWAKTEPAAAAAWSLSHAEEVPGGLSAVMQQWATADVTAASAWLAAQPAGLARDAAAPALVESLVYTDIPSARAWARGIADETTRAGMLERLELAEKAQ